MALPTPKELKQIASACRAAGIKSFKSAEFEFTLTDTPPISKPRGKAAAKKAETINQSINQSNEPIDTKEAQTPTEQELLYWSSSGGLPIPISPDNGGS